MYHCIDISHCKMKSLKIVLWFFSVPLFFVAGFSLYYEGPGDLPLQNPNLFEGDILGKIHDEERNAVVDSTKRWPNGSIPYELDTYEPYDENQKYMIYKAMKEYEENTCIRFVPKKDDDQDYILIFIGRGCYSNVGRKGGIQVLSLSKGCFQHGTIVHELGHAIGFYHEHTRSDRDDYIQIMWSNIMESAKDQFFKLSPMENRLLNSFDYNSVMLYGERTFSKDGWSKTMVSKDKNVKLLDVYDKKGLSESDKKRVNKLYECS